jgi:hypothetical protein
MESRSVLAYDIVPERSRPVVVTIASETGWSLVGVMGSTQVDSAGAIALISARGLDAAIKPLASRTAAAGERSVLRWLGPTRTPEERRTAKLRAGARPIVPARDAQRPRADTTGPPTRRSTAKRVVKTSKAKAASKRRTSSSRAKGKKGGRR